MGPRLPACRLLFLPILCYVHVCECPSRCEMPGQMAKEATPTSEPRPPSACPGDTCSRARQETPGEGLRGRWRESRQCQVRWPERPRRGRPTDALGQGVGQCFHHELARCGCFLNCPGDKEKAVHTFGQMPDGLPGQFSFSRAGFPSEGAALTCVVVLAPSWPTWAWGLCCPRPPEPKQAVP